MYFLYLDINSSKEHQCMMQLSSTKWDKRYATCRASCTQTFSIGRVPLSEHSALCLNRPSYPSPSQLKVASGFSGTNMVCEPPLLGLWGEIWEAGPAMAQFLPAATCYASSLICSFIGLFLNPIAVMPLCHSLPSLPFSSPPSPFPPQAGPCLPDCPISLAI